MRVATPDPVQPRHYLEVALEPRRRPRRVVLYLRSGRRRRRLLATEPRWLRAAVDAVNVVKGALL